MLGGAGNMPATMGILTILLGATCPPPSVLGIALSLAVLGWQCQLLQGALWVSLWACGGLAGTFYACCFVISASPQPFQHEEEEGVGAAAAGAGVARRRYLAKFREMVAYCMHVPSAILMNVVWR